VEAPDEEELAAYVKGSLAPLRASALRILGYREALRRELEGRTASEALGGPHADAVVGGLGQGASSQALHSRILGLTCDVEGVLSDMRAGAAPSQRLGFAWTPFVGFVSSVAEAVERCVPGARAAEDTGTPATSEEFLEALAEFLERYINFSPAHNRVTYFLWTLRKNLEQVALSAHPGLGRVAGAVGLEAVHWRPGVRLLGYPEYQSTAIYHRYGPSGSHGLLRAMLDAGECRSLGGAVSLLVDALWLYFTYSPDVRLLEEYLSGLENPAAAYMGAVRRLAPEIPCESGDLRGSTVRLGSGPVGLVEMLRGPAGALQFYGIREYFLLRGPHGDRVLCLDRGRLLA
jgi:hypothetical protein